MSSGRWYLATIAMACAFAGAACGSSPSSNTTRTPPPAQRSTAEASPAPQPTSPPARAVNDATGNLIDHPADITDAEIPPLPAVPFATPRPIEVVRAVFVFAARHPEVLSHVPCFCGCQNMGHQNNDDCFVKQRDARERPIAWEPHGMG